MKTSDAPRRTRRRTQERRETPVELHALQNAAVLLVGDGRAVALAYETGSTPMVLERGSAETAEDMIWYAQEHSVPVVDVSSLSADEWKAFQPGEEIPSEAYRAVANALALVHRNRSGADVVRFVRPLSRKPRLLATRAAQLVEEFGSILDVPMLYVEVGAQVWEHRQVFEEGVSHMRARIALESGQPLPPIPFRQSAHVPDNGYRIVFKDATAGEGELALPPDTPERVFPLVNRLRQLIVRNGWEMLTYDQVESLLNRNRKDNPGLYKQLFPHHFSVIGLRRILRNLLREGLSIRELTLILEVILEHLPYTQDADLLTELVRARFARELSQRVRDASGTLPVLVLDVEVEQALVGALREVGGVRWLDATPDLALKVLRAIGEVLRESAQMNVHCVLLVTPMLRRFVALLTASVYEDLPVLAYNEVAALTDVRAVATVKFPRTPLRAEPEAAPGS